MRPGGDRRHVQGHRIRGRTRLLVETESLINDGAAAVLFAVTLGWAEAGGVDNIGWDAFATLGRIVFGGFSIVVQGLTMPLLMRWLGFLPKRASAPTGGH